MNHILRLIAIASGLCFAPLALGQSWGPYGTQTTLLIEEYGKSISLGDIDLDGSITDADFVEWLADYSVGSVAIVDHTFDGVINCADAQIDYIHLLSGLSADFDQNTTIDAADIVYILSNFGLEQTNATKGDINGDHIIDSANIVEAVFRAGISTLLGLNQVAVSLIGEGCETCMASSATACDCPDSDSGQIMIDCSCAGLICVWIIPENESDPATTGPQCGVWIDNSDGVKIGPELVKVTGKSCLIVHCVPNPDDPSQFGLVYEECCSTAVKIHN